MGSFLNGTNLSRIIECFPLRFTLTFSGLRHDINRPVRGQSWIGLGSFFDGSGFASIFAFRDALATDDSERFFNDALLRPRASFGRVQSIGKLAQGINGGLEADTVGTGGFLSCGLLHQAPD